MERSATAEQSEEETTDNKNSVEKMDVKQQKRDIEDQSTFQVSSVPDRASTLVETLQNSHCLAVVDDEATFEAPELSNEEKESSSDGQGESDGSSQN